MQLDLSHRDPRTRQVARHFRYEHLRDEYLRDVSSASARLAEQMIAVLPDGPELVDGLTNLLRAKDSFVRAALPDDLEV